MQIFLGTKLHSLETMLFALDSFIQIDSIYFIQNNTLLISIGVVNMVFNMAVEF